MLGEIRTGITAGCTYRSVTRIESATPSIELVANSRPLMEPLPITAPK